MVQARAVILKECSGLLTEIDPVKIPYSPETGFEFLAACINVDVDDSGKVKRRGGYTTTGLAGSNTFHSLYSLGDFALGVKDTQLVKITPNPFTATAIATLTAPLETRVCYERVGELVYYLNGFEKGIYNYEKDLIISWVNNVSSYPETTRQYTDPPIGSLCRLFNGKMYIASANILWFSRPFSYSQFHLSKDFIMFEDDINLVEKVTSGLWVGGNGIYFLRGSSPEEFVLEKKADYSPVPGTVAYIPTEKLIERKQVGRSIVFATTEGICIGLDDGSLVNVSDGVVSYSAGLQGSGYYYDGKYVCSLIP